MGEKQRGRRQERVKGAREEDESFFTQAEHGDKRNKEKKTTQPFHLSNYIYLSLAKTKKKNKTNGAKGEWGPHTHTHVCSAKACRNSKTNQIEGECKGIGYSERNERL